MANIPEFSRTRRQVLATLCGLATTGLAARVTAMIGSDSSDDIKALVGRDICQTPRPLGTGELNSAVLPEELTCVGTRLLKQGFLDEVADLYKQHTGHPVHVIGGGCNDGLIATHMGKAHIGALCCPSPGSPAAGMRWIPVAEDLKVVLTTPDNPVDNISLNHLQQVAAGHIRNWAKLGGDTRAIALVVHNHCPSYLEPVRMKLLPPGETWSKYALHSNTDADHLRQIGRFQGSLGINSWILAEPYVQRGHLKVLSVDNVHPHEYARGEAYPLTGPLNLIFAAWLDDLMRPFLDFIYSEDARRIISKRTIPIPHARALELGHLPEYVALR